LAPDSPFVNELIASPNIGERRNGGRPRFLILHYTGLESFQRSIDVLRDPVCEVSCHYVVDVDGHVVQMVSEADRAWHAGLSCWQGETDINSWSIGIEIQNPGHDRGYPDFAEAQMQAVENLAGDIIARRKIRPEHVLAHSDIAPHRKNDPGEKFDWQRLAQKQIGHWVPSRPIAAERPTSQSMSETGTAQDQAQDQVQVQVQDQDEDRVRHCQALLRKYGYEVACDGMLDDATRRVIIAFQRHFRPARIDGLPDRSTIATLEDLLAALIDLDAPTPTV
jgi:N-acetylmuramoyl-L-alanine amidase